MCGRFVGYSTPDQIRSHFKVESVLSEQIHPSYNIAPQQLMAVITQESSRRILSLMHWGLVPFWSKDSSIGNKMINARSETVSEKHAFKNAFKNRRCLIVNDGFYEWKGVKGNKEPVFLKPKGEKGPYLILQYFRSRKFRRNIPLLNS
jgi:putative SOS response-associated peptidase YedK